MIGLFRQKYPDVAVHCTHHAPHCLAWQMDTDNYWGEVPSELQGSEILPYAEDELVLILPVLHPLQNAMITQKKISQVTIYCPRLPT